MHLLNQALQTHGSRIPVIFTREFFALAACVILFCPMTALAGPADTFGVSADSVARANAVVAKPTTTDAARWNPAALSRAKNVDLSLGIVVADDAFKIDDQPAHLDTFVGYNFGIAARVPLGSFDDRLFVGATLTLPHDGLYRVNHALPDEPRIIFHDAQVRHFELAASAALRIYKSFALGAGISLLPNVDGSVSIDFRENSNAHADTIQVDYSFSPIVGAYVEPFDGLTLGFQWQAANKTSMTIPVDIVVSEQIGAIHTSVQGISFGEPHTFTLGASYDFSSLAPNKLLRFESQLEFGFNLYTQDIASIAMVTLYDDQGTPLESAQRLDFNFDNAWHVATSLSWMPLDVLSVSAGYAFHKTPVPAQRSLLNLLDASHHAASFGITASLPQAWLSSPRKVGLSTAAALNFYQRREMEKYEFLPGSTGFPAITFDGFAWSWHLTLFMHF